MSHPAPALPLALVVALLVSACQPAAEQPDAPAAEQPHAPAADQVDGAASGSFGDPAAIAPTPSPTVISAPSNGATNPSPVAEEDACGASKVRSYIGREATVPVRIAVARVAGSTTDRWLYPGDAVTEDYNPTRLNVAMEKATNRITGMHCG